MSTRISRPWESEDGEDVLAVRGNSVELLRRSKDGCRVKGSGKLKTAQL